MTWSGDNLRDLVGIGAHFVRAHRAFTHLRGDSLTRYQDRRARRIVRFAAEHAPFYRTHWAGHNLADWRNLPVVDKRRMMENFDTFNTMGISRSEAMETALRAEESRDFTPTVRDRLTVGLSSGTSGHRGLFLVSPAEKAAWAGTLLARALPCRVPSGYRIALFLRSNSNLYERINVSRRITFRWFDLMTPLDQALSELESLRPHLLAGPPSLLLMLAETIRSKPGERHIRPERLISVAEVLEPQDRERLEEIFDCPVGQIYQCTEGLLAVTCLYGCLHLQEDLVGVQMEPLSPDDPLRVSPIVTDLWRRTQPILRYRLGDILRLPSTDSPPCRCGSAFRIIEAIEGRSDDLCWFPIDGSPAALRPFFPDTIRRMVLLAEAPILDYTAVQESPGHLRLYLDIAPVIPFDAVAEIVRQSAMRTVASYRCRLVSLEIEPRVPPVAPGAKRRRVRCLHEAEV